VIAGVNRADLGEEIAKCTHVGTLV
jgi:hypothetical protein